MKKVKLLFLVITLIASYTLTAQVAVNTDGSSADGSAMLDVKSTERGMLPPRMPQVQRQVISSPATGLMIYNTTSNKPNYYNGTEWMNFDGTSALGIGDFYQGGVVFYFFQNGDLGYVEGETHGLICAVCDQSTGAQWGCYGVDIPGAMSFAIGTGAQNTQNIVATCTTTGIAAEICVSLSLNSYTDWFLPSVNELNEMYNNKAAIDATSIANGGSAFAEDYYWTSVQTGTVHARFQYFVNGVQAYGTKGAGRRVRAVRAF